MIVNGYSIALLICSFASLFLTCVAARTALRVLRRWNMDSDSAAQIKLESETWLAALLVQLGLMLQIFSVFLLVIAADSFSGVLVGAMCAAGAFLANQYGVVALFLKIIGLFIYGYWIVLHRLDIRSEYFPLTRIKSWYLLGLIPLLAADLFVVTKYLQLLEPDIITSCCGVLFGNGDQGGYNLVGPLPVATAMTLYYALAVVVMVLSWWSLMTKREAGAIFSFLSGTLWLLFCAFSLLIITAVISSYIYAMPSHRCPFDILKAEYNYVGFIIYVMLFGASFFGSSAGYVGIFRNRPGLQLPLRDFQRSSWKLCLVVLPLYLLLISWYPASYLIMGGEY
jgi:hypothetical protein